jgi:hypothetical protein
VSFGEYIGAQKWFNELKLQNCLMITDENRVLYQLFGLKRSFSKVWNQNTLIYYAEQMRRQVPLPQAYKDVQDDPHQLAGDFIIRVPTMSLVYSYESKTPPDRPSAKALINTLKTFENKN